MFKFLKVYFTIIIIFFLSHKFCHVDLLLVLVVSCHLQLAFSGVPVNCETKRETKYTDTKPNETKFAEAKRNLPKRNEIDAKRNKSKRN